MSIVTISRGSYTQGRKVAERLGERLGYKVISRESIINTSEEFNIPEIKLKKALHNAPSILDKFYYGKEKYLAFIKANILAHLTQDNTIYHGLAGHVFSQRLDHELDIRIRADFEDRVKHYIEYIKKEEGKKITEKEARSNIHKDDKERLKWSIHLTGIDPSDPNNYDLVYNSSKLNVDDIVDSISRFLSLPYLQTTPESQHKIEQQFLAARVKANIVDNFPTAEVTCRDEVAYIKIKANIEQEPSIRNHLERIVFTIEGIKDVKVIVEPPFQF